MHVDLAERMSDKGGVKFLRVEWISPGSRLGILHCDCGEGVGEVGLRVDFDKRAMFDTSHREVCDEIIRAYLPEVCAIVAAKRGEIEQVAAE